MQTCKLCLERKLLIKKSHIIPDFLYKGIFDENHKLVLMPFKQGTIEKWEIKQPSDGEYQGGLLCADCDNKLLGSYEDYASKVMYGGQLQSHECPEFRSGTNPHGIGKIQVTKINYSKYKLFLLSLLWRAHVTTRPFFEEIKLSPEHSEEIRQMLYSGNPGEVGKYPIVMLSYVNDNSLPRDLIAQPRLMESKPELHVYSFMINGYFYLFYVNEPEADLPRYVIEETVRPSNELDIHILPQGHNVNFILGQFNLLTDENRIRQS